MAIRQGVLDGANPMREVRIQIPQTNVPKACKETGVYTLGEVLAMLRILPEPSRTVVGVAGFSGLRKGEIRALRLENWHDGAIWVEQSVWRGHFSEPKTKASAAPVPVIAPLGQLLEEHRRGGTSGLLFASRRGTPLNLDNLAKREIRPVLAKAGMEWRGWHAFRRGLATNLKQFGIDDKSIQAIMRHSDYQVTMNAYVKAVPESVQKAMSAFESAVCTKSAPEPDVRVV